MRGILLLSFTFQPGIFQKFEKIPAATAIRYFRAGLGSLPLSEALSVPGFSGRRRMSA